MKEMAGMVAKHIARQPILGDGQSTFFIVTRCDAVSEGIVEIVYSDNLELAPDRLFDLFIATNHSPNLREKKNTQNMPLVS